MVRYSATLRGREIAFPDPRSGALPQSEATSRTRERSKVTARTRSARLGLVRSRPLRESGEDGCGFQEAVSWIPRHPPDARPSAHRSHAESAGFARPFASPASRSYYMDGGRLDASARVIARASPPNDTASNNEPRTPNSSPTSCATRTGDRKPDTFSPANPLSSRNVP